MEKRTKILILTLLLVSLLSSCSKDEFLSKVETVVGFLGEQPLSSNHQLQGRRSFDEDHYSGSYKVEYENFTGEENLFGGCSLHDKGSFTLSYEEKEGKGKINLILRQGESEEILNEKTKDEIEIKHKPGDHYFGIKAENFTGEFKLKIEKKE